MTAEVVPLRTAVSRRDEGERRHFAWATDDPPLHARFRLEWRFRATFTYEFGLARLIAHEIDHLDGLLYTDRMHPDVRPIPVEKYRGTGSTWSY
ncbi:peptide deformylase [Kitasatospora sp. NPDC091276]|uniref:peptide deformylase n=1 Tax=Kitasatospora sp. NPDC091276 TaxID=3155300 RepID=UPI00343F81A6